MEQQLSVNFRSIISPFYSFVPLCLRQGRGHAERLFVIQVHYMTLPVFVNMRFSRIAKTDGIRYNNHLTTIQGAIRYDTRTAKEHPGASILLPLVGETWRLDPAALQALPYVQEARRLTPAYHLAARSTHPENTVVPVGDVRVGADFCLIAGPCAVESAHQIQTVAAAVKAAGAVMLRGGAFKPRTSPYTFQGLGEQGTALLVQAGRDTGLPTVTEITDPAQLDTLADVDVLQVGARNMQNFALLKALGRTRKPILLKRGTSATVEELLLSAEYILSGGNTQVILCERGIRSGLTPARAALDVSAVPVLKRLTHLPVIVDPSHAAGRADLVEPLALAAVAAGAAGLLVEVHDRPATALSDGAQSLTPAAFAQLAQKVRCLREALQ